MIRVEAALDGRGVLRSCAVRGHANAAAAGEDLVCAAVSALCRSAARVLAARPGVRARVAAPERGAFFLEADYTDASGAAFLGAAGEFLLEGLKAVAEDYPECCSVKVKEGATTSVVEQV